MKRTLLLIATLGALACERPAENRVETKTGPLKESPAAGPAATNTAATNTAATNTAKNERDRDPAMLTPEDQGGSELDRGLTQRVRQGVVKDDELSMTGKNIKIITREGVVTLRGPVKTAAEKTQIGAIASKTDGVKRVDNQLEIAAN
jgi:hyperosmotically inducible periplasmic protein